MLGKAIRKIYLIDKYGIVVFCYVVEDRVLVLQKMNDEI